MAPEMNFSKANSFSSREVSDCYDGWAVRGNPFTPMKAEDLAFQACRIPHETIPAPPG